MAGLPDLPPLDLDPLPPLPDFETSTKPKKTHFDDSPVGDWPEGSKKVFKIVDRKYLGLSFIAPDDSVGGEAALFNEDSIREPVSLDVPKKTLPYEIDSEEHAEVVCNIMCRELLKKINKPSDVPRLDNVPETSGTTADFSQGK